MTYQPPPYGQPPQPYGQQPHVPPPHRPNNHTGLWVMLGIFAAIFLLCGGCGLVFMSSASDSDTKATTTTRAVAAAPIRTTASPTSVIGDNEIADMSYIVALDNQRISYSSRESVIELAHTVCEARKAGNTAAAIALKIAGEGFSPADAGFIVGAAQSAYCPRFN